MDENCRREKAIDDACKQDSTKLMILNSLGLFIRRFIALKMRKENLVLFWTLTFLPMCSQNSYLFATNQGPTIILAFFTSLIFSELALKCLQKNT